MKASVRRIAVPSNWRFERTRCFQTSFRAAVFDSSLNHYICMYVDIIYILCQFFEMKPFMHTITPPLSAAIAATFAGTLEMAGVDRRASDALEAPWPVFSLCGPAKASAQLSPLACATGVLAAPSCHG